MDEQQLKKMDNEKKTVLCEETENFLERDSKISIAEWTLFGLALGFVMVVVGFFFWNKYHENQENISVLQSEEENINNN